MSDLMIEVKDLRRDFSGFSAVNGLSFEVRRGSVVGFIGANGAGKTTTMRILATLDLPTSGSAKIAGYDVVTHPVEVRKLIGWMPDSYGTDKETTVEEYIDFYARAFGYKGDERRSRVMEVMEFTNLASIADRFTNNLSKGMLQRLCLGRALLNDPELLILDEPAAGLDPKARIEFKHLVRLLAEEGKTLFISSHILSELGEMCDELLFLDSGKLLHQGSSESLLSRGSEGVVVRLKVLDSPERACEWVSLQPDVAVQEVLRDGLRLRLSDESLAFQAEFLKKMVGEGISVYEYQREERRLEEAFVEILGAKGEKGSQATLGDLKG